MSENLPDPHNYLNMAMRTYAHGFVQETKRLGKEQDEAQERAKALSGEVMGKDYLQYRSAVNDMYFARELGRVVKKAAGEDFADRVNLYLRPAIEDARIDGYEPKISGNSVDVAAHVHIIPFGPQPQEPQK